MEKPRWNGFSIRVDEEQDDDPPAMPYPEIGSLWVSKSSGDPYHGGATQYVYEVVKIKEWNRGIKLHKVGLVRHFPNNSKRYTTLAIASIFYIPLYKFHRNLSKADLDVLTHVNSDSQ
jgi:hypothetical protein